MRPRDPRRVLGMVERHLTDDAATRAAHVRVVREAARWEACATALAAYVQTIDALRPAHNTDVGRACKDALALYEKIGRGADYPLAPRDALNLLRDLNDRAHH